MTKEGMALSARRRAGLPPRRPRYRITASQGGLLHLSSTLNKQLSRAYVSPEYGWSAFRNGPSSAFAQGRV